MFQTAADNRYSAHRQRQFFKGRRQTEQWQASRKRCQTTATLRTDADISSVKGFNQFGGFHLPVWIVTVNGIPEPVYELQIFSFFTVREITRKSKAMKTGRKNMLEIHADEVGAGNSQKLFRSQI